MSFLQDRQTDIIVVVDGIVLRSGSEEQRIQLHIHHQIITEQQRASGGNIRLNGAYQGQIFFGEARASEYLDALLENPDTKGYMKQYFKDCVHYRVKHAS